MLKHEITFPKVNFTVYSSLKLKASLDVAVMHAYVPSTWEGVFTGKDDQQFKVCLSYTVGLSPAWDT